MFERLPGLPVFPNDRVARQLFFAGVEGAAVVNAVFGILAYAMLYLGRDPYPALVMSFGIQLYLISGLGLIYIDKQDGGANV